MNVAVRGNAAVGALTLLWAVEINNDVDIPFGVYMETYQSRINIHVQTSGKEVVHVSAHVS